MLPEESKLRKNSCCVWGLFLHFHHDLPLFQHLNCFCMRVPPPFAMQDPNYTVYAVLKVYFLVQLVTFDVNVSHPDLEWMRHQSGNQESISPCVIPPPTALCWNIFVTHWTTDWHDEHWQWGGSSECVALFKRCCLINSEKNWSSYSVMYAAF